MTIILKKKNVLFYLIICFLNFSAPPINHKIENTD